MTARVEELAQQIASLSESDLTKVFAPVMNFGFGFEISNISNHAVSKIYDFCRYTLIYTFKNT